MRRDSNKNLLKFFYFVAPPGKKWHFGYNLIAKSFIKAAQSLTQGQYLPGTESHFDRDSTRLS